MSGREKSMTMALALGFALGIAIFLVLYWASGAFPGTPGYVWFGAGMVTGGLLVLARR